MKVPYLRYSFPCVADTLNVLLLILYATFPSPGITAGTAFAISSSKPSRSDVPTDTPQEVDIYSCRMYGIVSEHVDTLRPVKTDG